MQMTSRKSQPNTTIPLHLIQHLLLEFPLNLLSVLIGVRLAVEVEEGAEVELGGLQQLDFADVDLGGVSRIRWVRPESERTFCNG